MTLREQLIDYCRSYVENRLSRLRASIKDLENDLSNETKSSAGDKYETSREMINAEIDNLGKQLQQYQKLKGIIQLAENRKSSENIQLGSVIKTTQANYFLLIPVGEIKIDKQKFYGIGINSPIGKLLLGKSTGERFHFQQQDIEIEKVD